MNKISKNVFLIKNKIDNKISNMTSEEKNIYKKVFSVAFIFCILMGGSYLFHADGYTIDSSKAETSFKTIFNDVYALVMGVATIIAVTLVAYNIVVIMSSKNQKKIDSAFTWIKAIVVAWLFIMLISIFITLIKQASGYDDVTSSSSKTGPLFKY